MGAERRIPWSRRNVNGKKSLAEEKRSFGYVVMAEAEWQSGRDIRNVNFL